MNTKSRRRAIVAGVIALSLVAAACGDDDSDSGSSDTTTAPSETTAGGSESTDGGTSGGSGVELAAGSVVVSGSSTVEPISIKVGELANDESGGKLKVTVDGPGTGDGFKTFCAGDTDINDASRKIKDEEAQACADAGIEYIELEIGLDGITVATSPNNSAITCLDTGALYALTGPQSDGIDTWAGANDLAAEVGSAYTDLPDAPLAIYGPGEESGTYDTYVEFAIAKIAEAQGQEAQTRADYTASPNDNLIVEGIEGSDTSLGWVGFAYYEAEQARMKAIEIADKEGTCVAPTRETIADGSYPFSRSLYIYVNKAKAEENAALASFVDLYLSEMGIQQVDEAGYVSLPSDRIAATQETWASRTTGSAGSTTTTAG